MKKIIGIVLTLLTVGILCAAKKWDPKLVDEFKNAEGTPEDSVVFYGGFYSTDLKAITSFTQTNSEFSADKQTMNGPFFISKPVKPGSKYILSHLSGTEKKTAYTGSMGNQKSVISNSFKKDFSVKNTPMTIEVPEEPGIYYFGYYDGRFTAVNEKLTEVGGLFKDMLKSDGMEETVLKHVIPLYKDTEWEEVLQKRYTEVQEENKAQNKK